MGKRFQPTRAQEARHTIDDIEWIDARLSIVRLRSKVAEDHLIEIQRAIMQGQATGGDAIRLRVLRHIECTAQLEYTRRKNDVKEVRKLRDARKVRLSEITTTTFEPTSSVPAL